MKSVNFRTNVEIVLRHAALLVIILLGSMKAVAQEWDHEYFPFVEEGKVWNCHAFTPSDTYISSSMSIDCIFTMAGDTLINENTYKKVSCQFKDFYGDEEQHYFCAVREEAYRVFIVENETKEEKLLYDFSHPQEILHLSYDNQNYVRGPGYHFGYFFPAGQFVYNILRGDVFSPTYFPSDYWIEGAGSWYSNPFGVGLHGNNPDPDPFFGCPIMLLSCMMDEKRLFIMDWMATWNPQDDDDDDDDDDDLTSIREMSNGTSGAPIYDLQGRRLTAAPQKGIYIQNGKKKLVK